MTAHQKRVFYLNCSSAGDLEQTVCAGCFCGVCHTFGVGRFHADRGQKISVRIKIPLNGNCNIFRDSQFIGKNDRIHTIGKGDLITVHRSVAVAVPVCSGIAALCKRDGFPQTGLAVKRIDIVRSIVHNKRPFFHTVVDGIRARIIHAVDPVIHTNGTVAAVLTRGVNRCAVTQPVIHAVRRELKRGRAVHAVPLAVGGIEVVVRAIQFTRQRTGGRRFTGGENGDRAVRIERGCCGTEFRHHIGDRISDPAGIEIHHG